MKKRQRSCRNVRNPHPCPGSSGSKEVRGVKEIFETLCSYTPFILRFLNFFGSRGHIVAAPPRGGQEFLAYGDTPPKFRKPATLVSLSCSPESCSNSLVLKNGHNVFAFTQFLKPNPK